MTYQVSLEKFNGPLDLLLSLIEEKKMAINEISLAQVADQFLEYLKKIEANLPISDVKSFPMSDVNDMEYQRVLADFLVVASRLVLIKSRSLLPNLVLDAEEDGDIKNLEIRLKAYQEIKMTAKMLSKWAKGRPSYASRESYFNLPVFFYPPKNIVAADLKNIYELFLKTLPIIEKLEEKSVAKIMSLEEKIEELMGRVSAAAEASFSEISGSTSLTTGGSTIKEKINIVLAFLAILTLFRKRILEISQNKLFGEIKIRKINDRSFGK